MLIHKCIFNQVKAEKHAGEPQKLFDTLSLSPHSDLRHHTCELHLSLDTETELTTKTLDQSRISFIDDWNVAKSCSGILLCVSTNCWKLTCE